VRHYVRLEIREVRDAGRRDRDAEHARRVEGESIANAIPASTEVIALTRIGKAFSSTELAAHIGKLRRESRQVTFLIGGAHGLAPSILEEADIQLSLSALTLPHELARLVLLEQLYRACTILQGEPYHKGG
jgi:23S rRNA (pseudouridine1915-N3)-methyltransferase